MSQDEPEDEQEKKARELSASECDTLRRLVQSLRDVRYGSIQLTVHDGRLVEIQKTVRIRMTA